MDRNRVSLTSFAVAIATIVDTIVFQSFFLINSGVNEIQCQIYITIRMFKLSRSTLSKGHFHFNHFLEGSPVLPVSKVEIPK